jgi:hypothetical protein
MTQALAFDLEALSRRAALGRLVAVAGVGLAATRSAYGAEPSLDIVSPPSGRVFQRTGWRPAEGRYVEGRSTGFGGADVPLTLRKRGVSAERIEVTATRHPEQFGPATPQTMQVACAAAEEQTITLRLPAGGWYRLMVRALAADGGEVASASLDRVGVGEVFLIAGQSYAGNHNDELLKVADPGERVTAWDAATGTWRVAHDPQPTTTGEAGSVWPALGELLLTAAQTPIGFLNVSVGATPSRSWLPDAELFPRIRMAMKAAGQVRAVLWQQGESDVLEQTPTAVYVDRLKTIRRAFAEEFQSDAPWLPAKSTHHPTVYDDAVLEGRIRDAIDTLWREPGFAPGPDTDLLAGPHRGPLGSQRHFTGLGQRAAAVLWFAAIWNMLQRTGPIRS